MLPRRIVPLTLIAALAATPVAAQGHGNAAGKGRKTPKAAEASVATGAPGTAIATSGFREFGSWLDDASIVDPGAGWFSVAFGHYNSPGSHQTDFPVALPACTNTISRFDACAAAMVWNGSETVPVPPGDAALSTCAT